MRLSGILILGFCVMGFGFYLTKRINNRLKQLNKIIYFIDYINSKIKYSKLTISEIFNLIDDKDLEFLMLNERDYSRICFNNSNLLLNENEKKALFDFLMYLGKSNVDSQLEHCESFRDIFKNYLKNNEIECNKKIKMYPSLFILLGLLIIVLLV